VQSLADESFHVWRVWAPDDWITNGCSSQEHSFEMSAEGLRYPDGMSTVEIEHRHLRSAIEFAVEMARIGQKARPALAFPQELKSVLSQKRVPTATLGRLRRAIEAATEFRRVLGVAATPELVDEIGRLWLAQPEGWEAEALDLVKQADAVETQRAEANELRKEQRRREAAEQAAIRSRTEVAVAMARVSELEGDVAALREEHERVQSEVAHLRNEIHEARAEARHERDRTSAARQEVARLTVELESERSQLGEVETLRDQALSERTQQAVETHQLIEAVEAARRLLAQLEEVAERAGVRQAVRDASGRMAAARNPLALPGGVLGDSELATDYLLRSGALVIVDGYNVTKLVWPSEELVTQRERLIDVAEAAAQRTGADIVIVFDGADVVGAHTRRRRMIRVLYSEEGSIADDLIRREVNRTPVDRPIVVVTNDGEVIRDVRAMGANTVGSSAFANWCRN